MCLYPKGYDSLEKIELFFLQGARKGRLEGGNHVAWGAAGHAERLSVGRERGESEVDELELQVFGEHDVLGLDLFLRGPIFAFFVT